MSIDLTPSVVKDSRVLPTGLGQGAYQGGAAGKLGGKDAYFSSFFFVLLSGIYSHFITFAPCPCCLSLN